MATEITAAKQREDVAVRPLVKQPETQAETTLAQAYAAARDDVFGAWRGERDRAFERFRALGLPSRRVEAWHYTDLRALMRDAYPVAAPNGDGATTGSRIDIIDGSTPTSLSSQNWPAGLRVRRLRNAIAEGGAAMLSALFPEQGADDAAVALNAAMARDGLVIEVAPGARIDAPIELAFSSIGEGPRADFSRALIVVGEGASVAIVESHASSARVQRNSALLFDLGVGATAEHVFVAEDHLAECHVATLVAQLGARARFNSFGFVASGALLRRQCFVRCAGEHAALALRGVSLLDGKRHADTTLVVDHAAPHGESRELFKHIVGGDATGVFQGKVIVRPGAQKVDGGMKSQAIMLSDDAAMLNKPELEIFADDVVCGHGATVGQLDDDQLFYLMARGILKSEAEGLLLAGFAREALDFVADEALRHRLDLALERWLNGRPG